MNLPLRSVCLLMLASIAVALSMEAQSPSQQGLAYYPVEPCRVLDTRPGNTPGGDGPLVAGALYSFDVSGGDAVACGVPSQARAAMLNFVAVGPVGAGHLTVWAWDSTNTTPPTAAVINFSAGTNIANGIAVLLCDSGTSTGGSCAEDLYARAGVKNTHLVVDVVGYFAAPGFGRTWGEGRTNSERIGLPSGLTCKNGNVAFGLSRHAVAWEAAASACPANTWVCTLEERGTAACDTARPDTTCDFRDCDGTCFNAQPDAHFGWVADLSADNVTNGVARYETASNSSTGGATCAMAPVWCCSAFSTQ